MKISLAYIDLEPSIYSEVVWGKQMEKWKRIPFCCSKTCLILGVKDFLRATCRELQKTFPLSEYRQKSFPF